MISGAHRVLHLHAEGGGVEHHDGIPAVQNITKLVALFIILLPQGKKCEYVFDVHTSKASEKLKVVLADLLTFQSKIFTWFKPRHNNIMNYTIIVCRPRQS
jgi:hypothetical protein